MWFLMGAKVSNSNFESFGDILTHNTEKPVTRKGLPRAIVIMFFIIWIQEARKSRM